MHMSVYGSVRMSAGPSETEVGHVVIDGCEATRCGCSELNSSPLQEKNVLLVAGQSFHLLSYVIGSRKASHSLSQAVIFPDNSLLLLTLVFCF